MKKLFLSMMLATCIFAGVKAQNVSSGCYRGYVDAGYSVGVGDYKFGRFEINTSHGYQINPYIFIGAGTGLHFMSEYKTPNIDIALDVRESKVDIPVFANARVNLTKTNISPFIDAKAGTFVTNGGGLYLNFSAGCRVALNTKNAINVSVGYARENLEFQTFDSFVNSSSMAYTRSGRILTAENINFKIGYEF